MRIQTECSESRIREAIETLRNAPGGPHILQIGSGSCTIREPVVLDGRDRGLTIEGAGDTFLCGGVAVSGWRECGEGVFCADLPPGADPAMLLIDDRPAELACYPADGRLKNLDFCSTVWRSSCNGGWNRPLNEYELTHMTVNPADLPPGFEPRNAVVTQFHSWDESTVRVKEYDAASGLFTFASRTEHPAGAFGRNEYVIRNIREGLTRPGQWMCDRVNRRLLYRPHSGGERGFAASIPLTCSIFRLEPGADGVTFRNLTLALGNGSPETPGLRAVNPPGLIQAERVRGTAADSLHFRCSAGSALRFLRAPDFRVENCVMERLGAGGVVALESCSAQIRNNRIEEIGLLCASAIPILAGGYSELMYVQLGSRPEQGKTVIEGNLIRHAPYCGIVCGGGGHEIVGNRISNVMKVLHDGAGIYVSRGERVRVADNVVSAPTGASVKQAHAIYLDELCCGCTVENNTMEGSVPFLAHFACRNMLRKNLIRNPETLTLEFAGCREFSVDGNTIETGGEVRLLGLPPENFTGNRVLAPNGGVVFKPLDNPMQFAVKNGELCCFANVQAERVKSWRRILFLGDSITHAGWYLALFQLYCSCRFPERGIKILNGGISGQRAADALRRLDEDVIARRPDAVILCFGINDIERDLYLERTGDPEILRRRREALEQFDRAMSAICDRLKQRKIDVVTMTPCAYDEYGSQPETNLAVCNSIGVCRLVKQFYQRPWWCGGMPIIDLYMPTSRLYAAHPELKIAPDRVHPDRRGHVLIAATLAATLFPEPAEPGGLPFPVLDECRQLAPYTSVDALYNTGGTGTGVTEPLVPVLEAWFQAEHPVRSLVQVEELLKKHGVSPAGAGEPEFGKLLEVVPGKYRQYYENLFADYIRNRPRRAELEEEAARAGKRYFDMLRRIRSGSRPE